MGGIFPYQFGFRKGRSTLNAIEKVLEIANGTKTVTYRRRKSCLLIILDIHNAFNSASYQVILDQLKKKISDPTLKMIRSYLDDRKTLTKDKVLISVNSGVLLGSMLAVFLWNVMYDGILKIPVPTGVNRLC